MQLYTKLQSSHTPSFVNHLKNIPKLPDESKHNMQQEITEDELLKVLKTTDNNKSLGDDGYLVEFYKVFWADIKTVLFNSYKYAYETGQLSTTQKRGLMSLIPKKEKNPLILKNWHPLSLLNADYKLLAKTITTRITDNLPHIICDDQTV